MTQVTAPPHGREWTARSPAITGVRPWTCGHLACDESSVFAPIAIALCASLLPDDGAPAVVAMHSASVLVGMRAGAALLWPDYGPGGIREAPRHVREAFTRPPELRGDRSLLESDGDPWTVNVVGHALFGSEIYLRARQCGTGIGGAFAWAAGTSVLWEYGLEATVKRPSAIDLAWTPIVGGLLVGELRFALHRWLGRGDPGAFRRAVRGVVDPLGTLERAAGTRC